MIKSFKHQAEIFERFKDKDHFALFLEAGTGKTRITIQLLEHAYNEKRITAALILVPKTMISTWAQIELPKHSAEPFKAYAWDGKTNTKTAVLFDEMLKFNGLSYLIANHDAITGARFQDLLNKFWQARKKVAFIIDESTAIKIPSSARTKVALKMANVAAMKGILTGTPLPNGPLDVYTQCEFLDPKKGILGHASFYSFKTRYAVLKRQTFGFRSFDTVVGYRDLDDLRRKLDKFAAFVKLEECIDMPPQVFSTIAVELTPEQASAYKELKEKAVAYIQSHEIVAINALSLLSRLHQILVGQIKVGADKYLALPSNRLEIVKSIMEERDHKILIWCPYVEAAKQLHDGLGLNAIRLTSDMNTVERHDTIENWRHMPIQGLILNAASAGHGLTLTEAKTAIFYGNTYNLEHRLQALRRNYRIGQDQKTEVIDIIALDTVEEKIMKALTDKQNIAELVTNKEALLELIS